MATKKQYSGLIVLSLQDDEENLAEILRAFGQYTDAMTTPRWASNGYEVCLLSVDGQSVHSFCLVKRGQRIVTGKYRVTFSNFVDMHEIHLNKVLSSIKSGDKAFSTLNSRSGIHRLRDDDWLALLNAAKTALPDKAADLDRLIELRATVGGKAQFPGAEQVAQEKDAIGLALDIFEGNNKLRKGACGTTHVAKTNVAPFLEGVEAVKLTEEQMLAHDASIFPDGVASQTVVGVQFEAKGQVLDVVYQNRTSVEKTLGVDLIYYNHRFDAYTLVQYKRMEQAGGDEAELDNVVFYPNSDSGFSDEIKRMQNFRSEHPDAWSEPKIWQDYRLDGDGFFFKLCPSVSLDPLSPGLLKGMYLPREYVEVILEGSITDGPRGGKVISYRNVQRHMDNTRFTWAVRDGWVGTRGVTSTEITKIVKAGLDADRAVIVAKSSDMKYED